MKNVTEAYIVSEDANQYVFYKAEQSLLLKFVSCKCLLKAKNHKMPSRKSSGRKIEKKVITITNLIYIQDLSGS